MAGRRLIGWPKPLLRRLRRGAVFARDRLYPMVDAAVAGVARVVTHEPSGGSPRVAIVLVHGIGDLVIWRGALHRLRAAFAADRYEITLFCMASSLEFARAHGAADRLVPVDRQRFRTGLLYRERIVWRTARERFDVALQPSLNRYFLVEDALVRATGAAQRIGSAGTGIFLRPRERRISDRWYTRIVAAPSEPMHDLRRTEQLMAGLGIAMRAQLMPLPRPAPPDEDLGGYLLFGLSTSTPIKTWPLERFEALAHAVAARTAYRIVFCGSGLPDGLARRFRVWDGARFVDRLGTKPVAALVALVAGAALVVASDTGLIHIAAALGRPSVVIVGGGLPERYHPYTPDLLAAAQDPRSLPAVVTRRMDCFGCGWHCVHPVPLGQPAPCIDQISLPAVLDEILRRLPATEPEAGDADLPDRLYA